MIDPKAIRKELRRLSGLSFAPTEPEGWAELANVLQRHCSTVGQVQRVLDRWLETEENVPKPSQLAALCSDIRASDRPVLPAPCGECDGLWRWVERLDKDGQIVSFLARCTCARGRQLAAMDAKRAMEEENSKQAKPLERATNPPLEEIG